MMLHETFAYASLIIICLAFLIVFLIDWLLKSFDFPNISGSRGKIKYIRNNCKKTKDTRCKLILRLDFFLKILIALFLLSYIISYYLQEA